MSRFTNDDGLAEDGWDESGKSTEDAPLTAVESVAIKRFTVALALPRYLRFTDWIHQNKVRPSGNALTMVDTVRALLEELDEDEDLARRVLARVDGVKSPKH